MEDWLPRKLNVPALVLPVLITRCWPSPPGDLVLGKPGQARYSYFSRASFTVLAHVLSVSAGEILSPAFSGDDRGGRALSAAGSAVRVRHNLQ